jgi:diguanylate cyclase (GGDEF)-like protein
MPEHDSTPPGTNGALQALQGLSELLQRLVSCPDVDAACSELAAGLAAALPGSTGTVSLAGEDGETSIAAAWSEGSPGDVSLLKRLRKHTLPIPLCLPLQAFGEDIGELRIWWPNADAAAAQASPAGLLAQVAELTLGALQLKQRLNVQSVRDGLTGLFTRRYLEDTLGRELHRAQRSGAGLGVVMFDVDGFKAFNAAHGNRAGDQVLLGIGGLLLGSFRGSDVCCRYAGQRFVVLLPGADLENTLNRAQQLQALVGRLQTTLKGHILPAVSVTVGVAHFPEHADNVDDLIAAADSAVFLAKQQGPGRTRKAEKLE